MDTNNQASEAVREIYLAGGCFWGMEKYMSLIEGVVGTEVGYANGDTENPSYEDVCRRNTGHAETVKVRYQADRVSLAFLLDIYYEAIDPLALNRQGNDVGRQYRTGIYYTDAADRPLIEASLARLQERFTRPVAIEVQPLMNYFPAEEYHQDYLGKNPRGYCHIGPDKFERAKSARPAR